MGKLGVELLARRLHHSSGVAIIPDLILLVSFHCNLTQLRPLLRIPPLRTYSSRVRETFDHVSSHGSAKYKVQHISDSLCLLHAVSLKVWRFFDR
ncbi:hypothetical protein DM860_014890 [Cuscuta australis]|uniref:Uncharacterized protein n=1 Tax=Cuscuta australis TaxID=267555 RepID=A0A328DMR7_9ASTE|nr:hypothetical protein DM860_014890 [Cuscuta australis]